MSDDQLRRAIVEELAWDPKIDSSSIDVSADSGVVTLRGTVGSYAEKCEAGRDALRVRGIRRLQDELIVELFDECRRDDRSLRAAVLQALRSNSFVPSTIEASAEDGRVMLLGSASSHFQRAEAEHVTERIRGVRGVTNAVILVPFGPAIGDVAGSVIRAMGRSARLDATSISVSSTSGTVNLSGSVASWADHDDAILIAWNAPAVVHVVDELLVIYR